MEKIPNKHAMLIRVICYILIPICVLSIIQSIISLVYFENQEEELNKDNYFESKQYSTLYMESIYSNMKNCYYYKYPEYYIDTEKVILSVDGQEGIINYRDYLNERNFKFLIVDNKTNTAFTNLEQTMRTDTIEELKQELQKDTYQWKYSAGNVETNIQKLALEEIKYIHQFQDIEKNYDCTIYTSMSDKLTYYDTYYTNYTLYKIAGLSNDTALINLPIAFIILLICIFLITIYTGRKKGQKQVYLNWFDKLPLEVAGLLSIIIMVCAGGIGIEVSSNNTIITIICLCISITLFYIIGIASYETIVKRTKAHIFWKNTLIYRLIRATGKGTKNVFDNFNLATKILLSIIGFIVVTIIIFNICNMFISNGNFFFALIILITIVTIMFKYIFNHITKFLKIRDTIKQLYEGNTEVKLDEKEYVGVLKELVIYVNDIAGGFTNAIEKSLKSEKFRTELITNVSHDIKTPLTSIINYVDLLKKEEMPNEKSKEYLEILDQKSQRLKKLTEDLVEASKASSGNIKLNIEKLNVKELIKQVSGEFEDKIKDRNLELILTMSEDETIIQADSRYLYRIIENMYSNVTKYALEGSRVYVDILSGNNKVKIEIKNTSKEKLNITAEELMQRFVRGDSSRNTEGSGLGLSIAQSLTELQKGKFSIYLDGDLFKVTIEFEKI